MDNTKQKNKAEEETVEDIFSSKSESDNSRFDITGSMTTWHTHETYSGTGNHESLWDDLLKEKRLKEKAEKAANEKSV